MHYDLLKQLLADQCLDINNEQLEKFSNYYYELIEWNKDVNLTAITDEQEVIIKHFYDSLLGMNTVGWHGTGSLIDIGSGAGFPGIPLKIMNSNLNIVMLDSLQKRIKFLEHMIDKLSLENTAAIHGRAEEIGQDKTYRESFDLVTSRAVAKLPVLAELCLPFIKIGGSFIVYKGPEGREELKSATNAIDMLGGRVIEIKNTNLSNNEHKRTLITIEKIKQTPSKFPRRAGMPSKKPL